MLDKLETTGDIRLLDNSKTKEELGNILQFSYSKCLKLIMIKKAKIALITSLFLVSLSNSAQAKNTFLSDIFFDFLERSQEEVKSESYSRFLFNFNQRLLEEGKITEQEFEDSKQQTEYLTNTSEEKEILYDFGEAAVDTIYEHLKENDAFDNIIDVVDFFKNGVNIGLDPNKDTPTISIAEESPKDSSIDIEEKEDFFSTNFRLCLSKASFEGIGVENELSIGKFVNATTQITPLDKYTIELSSPNYVSILDNPLELSFEYNPSKDESKTWLQVSIPTEKIFALFE